MVCTIIGRIRVPAQVGQAVRVNGLKCSEETVWNLSSAFGGESYSTDFYVENRSGLDFPIEWDMSSPTGSEYTFEIVEDDGVTPVTMPFMLNAHTTVNWKLKVEFDKYIEDDTYELVVEFDFV